MCLYSAEPCYYPDELIVKAATTLALDSSTETIDVARLGQATARYHRYVEVADVGGRLLCVDGRLGADCWLKIVSIANDCQSCNVVLVATSHGMVLRTIRNINPGEPLLMWFAENVLAMMNMPYLTNMNIQESRYSCHMCHLSFDYPNPLKIHLALQCDRLDSSFLWAQLAREFSLLAVNLFQALPSFTFNLLPSAPKPPSLSPPLSPPMSPPMSPPLSAPTSPILHSQDMKLIDKQDSLEDLRSDSGYGLSSPSTSGLSASSAGSDDDKSPASQRSLCFSSSPPNIAAGFPQTSTPLPLALPLLPPAPPLAIPLPSDQPIHSRHSAFKPYSPKCRPFSLDCDNSPTVPSTSPAVYRLHSPATSSAVIVRPDAQAAHMETLVSNLGKSNDGHRCLYCGKIYSRKYGLKIHIRTHTGYKPLKCKVCQRPFGDPSNLNKHIRLHAEGELSYK